MRGCASSSATTAVTASPWYTTKWYFVAAVTRLLQAEVGLDTVKWYVQDKDWSGALNTAIFQQTRSSEAECICPVDRQMAR